MEKSERRELRRLKKEQQNNLIAFNAENDIKYRAPFGINHVRTLAWICVIILQIVCVVETAGKIRGEEFISPHISEIIQMISGMSLPLFLLASFSYILQNKENSGKIVLFYLFASAIIPILFYLIFYHLGAGLFEHFSQIQAENARSVFLGLITTVGGDLLNCNIFIDMLLFSSLTYFLTAEPKSKAFEGKRKLIFRAFGLVPILYEAAAFIYKLLLIFNKIEPNLMITSLLPTKAPLTFIAFALILAAEIAKKRRYLKLGGSEEGYNEFFMTNKNSLMFAKSTAKIFAFVGLTDLTFMIISFIILSLGETPNMTSIMQLKLGYSSELALLAPFILLFSYNKKPKFANYNLILPFGMICVIIIIYLEAGYFMITGNF